MEPWSLLLTIYLSVVGLFCLLMLVDYLNHRTLGPEVFWIMVLWPLLLLAVILLVLFTWTINLLDKFDASGNTIRPSHP